MKKSNVSNLCEKGANRIMKDSFGIRHLEGTTAKCTTRQYGTMVVLHRKNLQEIKHRLCFMS